MVTFDQFNAFLLNNNNKQIVKFPNFWTAAGQYLFLPSSWASAWQYERSNPSEDYGIDAERSRASPALPELYSPPAGLPDLLETAHEVHSMGSPGQQTHLRRWENHLNIKPEDEMWADLHHLSDERPCSSVIQGEQEDGQQEQEAEGHNTQHEVVPHTYTKTDKVENDIYFYKRLPEE